MERCGQLEYTVQHPNTNRTALVRIRSGVCVNLFYQKRHQCFLVPLLMAPDAFIG